MLDTFIAALDWLGITVFAVTGALVASRKQMDVVGFALLATVTGVGGGTVRDLCLGLVPVFWVEQPAYVAACVAAAVVVFFAGLSFFCIVGAERALDAGTGPAVAIMMGIVTATIGGVIRDVLGGEIPVVLRKEIYVTAALAGGLAFVGLVVAGVPQLPAAATGFAVCFVVRGAALLRGWSLPVYRPRPGRDPGDLGL